MFPSRRGGIGLLLLGLLAASVSLARAECTDPPPVFGQNLVATNPSTLSWALPADVDVVRGPLSHMGLYASWGRGSLLSATSLDISTDNPGPGQGFYYLLKPSDPCGSWQSTVGFEPQRDLQIHVPCSQTHPTTAEIDSAVSAALVGLSDPWGDDDQFIVLFDRIQDTLACAFEVDLPAAALAGRSNVAAAAPPCVLNQCPFVFYCGPGNTASGWAFPAGPCLNTACFNHDHCSFLGCVSSKPPCYFSPQSRSTGCDDPLFLSCAACLVADEVFFEGWQYTDAAICAVAAALSVIPRGDPSCAHPPCDDTDRNCLVDTCSPQSPNANADTGCVTSATFEPSNINGNCSDSFSCTSPDFCSVGACLSTNVNELCPENSLTDADADCRRDACNPNGAGHDPTTGCVPDAILEPSNVAGNCADGYLCTTPDFCMAGACIGMGEPELCPDNSTTDADADCKRDACSPTSPGSDPITGCVADRINEPNNIDGNCVDAYACTSPDYCIGGVCNGTPQNANCGEVSGDCVSNLCSPGTAGTDSAGCIALCNLTVCGPNLAWHCSGCVCLPP
jgi:hypothetical protein